jgi:hypothetical protein
LALFKAAFLSGQDYLRAMQIAGIRHPDDRRYLIHAAEAVRSALTLTPIGKELDLPAMPPSARHTMTEILLGWTSPQNGQRQAGWADVVNNQLRRRLGDGGRGCIKWLMKIRPAPSLALRVPALSRLATQRHRFRFA